MTSRRCDADVGSASVLPTTSRVTIPAISASYYSSSLSLMAAIAYDDMLVNGSTGSTPMFASEPTERGARR